MSLLKWQIAPFLGGFTSTLVFHQGLVATLYFLGVIPISPFNMAPTSPLGVPSVISLSFFGGLWGILIWFFVKKSNQTKQIIQSIVYGAIDPTAVAFLVVFPLKGMDVPLAFIPVGLILNGAWGLGLWLFMKQAKHFCFKTKGIK